MLPFHSGSSINPIDRLLILCRPGITAYRSYWRIFLIIQLCAAAFVFCYYQSSQLQAAMEGLVELQGRYGLLFAAVTTSLSGAIVPELLKLRFRPPGIPPLSLGGWFHRAAMMASAGIMVHLFYQAQAWMFGSGNAPSILAAKILFDQLFFTPVVAIPFLVTWFLFHENGYRPTRVLHSWNRKTLAHRAFPMWVTCLTFWPFTLIFVYSMPVTLQFPLFLFANTAFSLVMLFVAANDQQYIDADSGAQAA